MDRKTVLLIMGSTRAGRICPVVSEWVADIGRACTGFTCELIDLAQWPLPMDDEPGIPAAGRYVQSHTQAWSEKVANADAVVFVTPQYNWGYPAALKNAIDHLYREWAGKPAAIVTYGGHGGTKCAAQLRQVAEAVKMRLVASAPAITLADDVIRNGRPIKPDADFQACVEPVKQAFRELATCME
jgi:NAD(P)H-dependent FMN reductase